MNINDKAKEVVGKIKVKTMEKVSMLKTEEGRKNLAAKAKVAAMTAKDKTIALWKSGTKGKVALCIGAILISWFVISSCNGSSDTKGATAKSSGGKAMLRLKKLRNTDALFYEGPFPQGTSGIDFEDKYNAYGDYKSVAPNVIVLPDSVSMNNLCGCFDPELEDWRRKGTSYLNDPNDAYHCIVDHVEHGHVIVKPNSISMYGNDFGYVETDDEYVEGARLKLGFYTFLGTTRKVPLTNGSSLTMYAFRKVDDKVATELIKAIEYNGKACEAAEKENVNRNSKAIEQKAKDDQKFVSNLDAGVDEVFRKALAEYDDTSWKSHIHVSGALKGKVKIADASKWRWIVNGETQEMTFDAFKRQMEKEGGAKYLRDNGTPLESLTGMFVANTKDVVVEHANGVFKSRRYQLEAQATSGKVDFVCYKIEYYSGGGLSIIPANPSSESDMTFQLYESLAPFAKMNVQFYIVDKEKDEDIVSLYARTGNSGETERALKDKYKPTPIRDTPSSDQKRTMTIPPIHML